MRIAPAALVALLLTACAQPVAPRATRELVQAYLWPRSLAEFDDARASLAAEPSLDDLSLEEMSRVEGWMREGRPVDRYPETGGTSPVRAFEAPAPGERTIPVLVRLPTQYTLEREWPLILAMHGGPPGSAEGATEGAARMIDVWTESAEAAGWIVVSPAMVSAVARDGRTQDRLPYEIFHPEEARAVVDAVRARYRIDPDRIVSTGISLGSNFSIGFGASHPDWLSGIVPVSTEGDSRELLLRNLKSVPTYVLEGAQDQNIRGLGGPRALDQILTSFNYDPVYREFGDRAHEGFQEHYPEVLDWLTARPRRRDPHQVLRVPHEGIMPVSRWVHWVESDARQGVVRAAVVDRRTVEISARWATELTVYLNDDLVDLDAPVTVRVNGEVAHEGRLRRSARVALEEARRLGDHQRVYAARLTVPVPSTASSLARAQVLWSSLTPTHPEGQLSFWEMYAARALEERFPGLGFDGVEVALPAPMGPPAPEQVAIEVTALDAEGEAARVGLQTGDILLAVGGEPFFAGRGGVANLERMIRRELREYASDYPFRAWRQGEELVLDASLALGPYRDP